MIEKMSKNAPKGQLNQNYKLPNNSKPIEEKKDVQKDKLDNLPINKKTGKSKKPNAIQQLKEQIINDRKSKEILNSNNMNIDDDKKKEQEIKQQKEICLKKNNEKAAKTNEIKLLNQKRKHEKTAEPKIEKKEPSIKIKIPLIKEDADKDDAICELDLSNEENKKLPEAKRVEIMEMKLKQAAEENKKLSMQKMSVNDMLQDLNKFKKKN